MANGKKLYRSRTDKKLGGVLGGFTEYIGASDSTIVRLIYTLITLFTGVGLGVLIYIICAIVIPESPIDVEQ